MKDPRRAVRTREMLLHWQNRKDVETSNQDIAMQGSGENTFDKINV